MIVRASSTPRAFRCPGSVRLCQAVPERPESDNAREGTAAHWVGEMVLTDQVAGPDDLIDRAAPNGVMVGGDMADNVAMYSGYVSALPGIRRIEQEVSVQLGPITVPGQSDSVLYDPETKTLTIVDLKYGFRLVEAVGNWQLICYALGAIDACDVSEIENVVLVIVQPRPSHPDGKIREWRISRADIEGIRKQGEQIAEMIVADDPQTFTGPQCRNCDAIAFCPAAQSAGMNAIDISHRAVPTQMDNDILSYELIELERAEEMLKNRREALAELCESRIREGQNVPGWSLTQKLGKTTWLDNVDMDMIESIAGRKLREEKPVTPAAAKRLGVPAEIVDGFTTRPLRGWSLTKQDMSETARKLFGGK